MEDLTSIPAGGGTEAQVIIDAALAGVEPAPVFPDDLSLTHVIVPAGAESKLLDLEPHLFHPRRAKGTARFDDLHSLVAYVKRYDDPSTTTLWVGYHSHSVIAVIDDDATEAGDSGPKAGDPGWRGLRAELKLQPTPEWERWSAIDNKLVPQGEFAQHIEQSIPDIAEPDGADLLEIAENFHATTTVSFRSGVKVQSGTVTLLYDEHQDATAGKSGQLQIPRTFVLAIAPFIGQPLERIDAKLRWSTSGHQLRIGYVLERPHEVIRRALDELAKELGEAFDGRVFRGSPPAAR